MYGCGKVCLILIPFRLLHFSGFPLSLKCFSSDSDNCPRCGGWTPASVPSPAEGRPSPTNTPVSPPTSFILPSFVALYILFRWSGTPVCSQLVFGMHFYVCRCVPDVSVERDVFHVHLLLRHLQQVPFNRDFKKYNILTLVVRRTGREKWGRLFSVLCRRDLMV